MQFLLIAFPALFSIVNPIGGAFIFLTATKQFPHATRARIAGWVAIYSFIIMCSAMFIGAYVLSFFGISLPVLRVGGGIVIILSAWKLLNAPDDVATTHERKAEDAQAVVAERETVRQIAFYPLTMPLTTGPGTIAVAVSLGTSRRPQVYGDWQLFGFVVQATLTALLIAMTIWLLYRYADGVSRRIGPTGSNIIMRLSAFLLFCIGIQVMWGGASELLKETFG